MNDVQLKAQMEHVEQVIRTERFQGMTGLGGEIPFWVAPYPAELNETLEVELGLMVGRLASDGIRLCSIDLYALSMDLLGSVMGMEDWARLEEKKGGRKMIKRLHSALDIQRVLIPAITEKLHASQASALVLHGVGKVFPFIRSHTVLNNLQSEVTHCPTLMFFPGEYDNTSLKLFGRLKDDNYYRAFNIFDFNLNETA